jgi:DNA-binding response OmpR family regulator
MMVNKRYDIVVMEANLPGLNGGELAQITKNMSPDTKVVLMIRDEYSDDLRDISTDVDDVLLKPFAPEELVKIAKRLLEPGEKTKAEHKLRLPFS